MIRYAPIADGNAGILQTAAYMRQLILQHDPGVRERAEAIVIDAGVARAPNLWPAAIYTWVQARMVYTPDVEGQRGGELLDEEIRAPRYLLGQIQATGYAMGDCDDYVILLAALMLALGIRPLELVLVSAADDGTFDHVYLLVQGTPADAIHGEPFGWEVPADMVTHRRVIPI